MEDILIAITDTEQNKDKINGKKEGHSKRPLGQH